MLSLDEDQVKIEFRNQIEKKSRSQPANFIYSDTNNPSQPVVGITWFEACAYCVWLSESTGKEYRLPNEAEWESAACGVPNSLLPDKIVAHKYPWGNDWNKEKANTIEGRVFRPSPVGAYSAAGAISFFGAEDQAGNVWEWTSSLHVPYPYNSTKSETKNSIEERVLRGGSWYYGRSNACCTRRYRFVPDLFDGFSGFRIAS